MPTSAAPRNEERAEVAVAARGGPDAQLRQFDGMRLLPLAAFALALLPALLLLFTAPFNPDEVESFRAVRWIASGRVPFRDFWEHHLPLHWLLLSPFARFTRSATVESLLVLRVAQLPLLVATLYAFRRMLARAGVSRAASLFGASFFFLAIHRSTVEIRVDVTMNLFLLAGLLALTWDAGESEGRLVLPFLGGVSLGLACLASQRAMPIALVAAASASIPELARSGTLRWRRLVKAPLLAATGLLVVAFVTVTVAWLAGALPALREQCFRLNYLYERLPANEATGPSAVYWALRFLARPGAVALVALGFAGAILGIRDRRLRPLTTVAALLAASQAGLLLTIRSPFPYHFQTLFWFLALLSVVALDLLMRSGPRVAAGIAALAGVLVLAGTFLDLQAVRWGVMAETLAHQDHVLRTVERASPPGSVVLEGCGFAVNRVPAMTTWFLPSLARGLMAAGVLPAPTPAELATRRIALVVADSRLLATVKDDRALGPFVARSFFPIERFVWAPAPNALLRPGERIEWTVLTSGPHRLVEVPLLASLPWFSSPWSFPFQRPRSSAAYRLDTAELRPPDPDGVRFLLDGAPLPAGPNGHVALRAGSSLSAENTSTTTRAVLVLPASFRVVLDAPFPSSFIEPNLEF